MVHLKDQNNNFIETTTVPHSSLTKFNSKDILETLFLILAF